VSRVLAWLGAVALVFGLGTGAVSDPGASFARVNVAFGALALGAAALLGARRLGAVAGPLARRGLWPAAARVGLALLAAVAVERAAAFTGLRFDWTAEGRYEPDAALVSRIDGLCEPVEVLLFGKAGDRRLRRTRLWLETLARHEKLSLHELDLAEAPPEAHRYAVGGSNRLVLRRAGAPRRFERVERPGEGGLYEALTRLCARPEGRLLWLDGEGQGDPELRAPQGYSGLAAALETEGYAWQRAPSAGLDEIPESVAGVLVVAPERPLHPRGAAALERYLQRGGRLVALLEPGTDSGLDALLALWGIESPPAAVLDAPGPAARGADANALVVQHWETHPISAGLGPGRAGYLPGARSFALRKPDPDDRLDAVAWSGPQARRADEPARAEGRYLPVAVAGRYPRGETETRIFAAGDADFASNHHLRSVYNLDLVLNAVHWTLSREAALTLRPKLRETVQFPLPTRDALGGYLGLGLLVPELLLAVGGAVWLRRREG